MLLIMKLLLLNVFVGLCYSLSNFQWQTYSKMNHFTKRVSVGIYTGGRITTRQIEYLKQVNYSSLLTITIFPTNDVEFHGISGDWPSTEVEETIATTNGLNYTAISTSLNVESYEAISALLISLPKPIYMHCNVSIYIY